jgi:hypothetical protein
LDRVLGVARQGLWWRGALAVSLLLGGIAMWLWTGDGPKPWSKRTRSLAPAIEAQAKQGDDATDGPELALALATTPKPQPAVTQAAQPKPLRVTDFFAEPPPEPLASAYTRLKSGTRLSATDVKALMSHDEEHPGDPRVQLLFAYDSMRLEWKRAAIGHYLQAYRIEPQAREDVRMLSDLIVLAGDAQEGERASDAIEEIFGIDALPGIEDAINDAEQDSRPELAARLAVVRDRLRP